MYCRLLVVLLCLALAPNALAQQVAAPERGPQIILHLLDYVAVEYPQFVQGGMVVNLTEYAEQVEFAGQIRDMVATLPADPKRETFARQAGQLLALIDSKGDGAQVAARARALQQGLIAAYRIPVAPKQAPDLTTAAPLYAARCATCHGSGGDGAGPQAAKLEPHPSNFRDTKRQSARSVFGLFNTITLGVDGTAMAAFSDLSAEERWKLAFYVSQFAASDAQRARGAQAWARGEGRTLFSSLPAVVTMTPAEARQQGSNTESILAYLRAEPALAEPSARTPIAFSIATLGRSFEAYRSGNAEEAYQLAVTAYLEGFELVEASLDNRDRELRTRTEAAMMGYRNAIKAGRSMAEVETDRAAAVKLLEESQQRLIGPAASPTANFVSSLIIILREGLEAILVLAAMAAFLVRTGRHESLPWLHVGWIAALLLGGLTWVISSKLIAISGAHREVTEGITALVAASLLLYVGFWLHSKANAARWNQFIKSQMTTALSGGALFSIALVSFLAVYREVFETVLFYQALWVQSEGSGQTAVIAGLGIGVAALAVLAWLIARFSVRLPLGTFFAVSSVLLAVMAVVFAGQGIAALQEAGKLASNRIDFPSIPLLGIYPNLQGLTLQLALVTIIVIGFVYLRGNRRA
ncbi:MAG TPA: cytochrome c/FTR1 family iron permease [Roseiflexaceae bacterium]|jgi:high-affinity iron transporter